MDVIVIPVDSPVDHCLHHPVDSSEGFEPLVNADDALGRQLIGAAAAVFAERGYSGARVNDIAEQAGLTTGAIYNRFPGKSALLLEALDAYSSDIVVAAEGRSASDLLRHLAASLLDDSTMATRLLLESFVAARREPDVAQRLRPRLKADRDRLAGLIDADKRVGDIATDIDTTAMVTFCQAVALGMRMLVAIDSNMPAPLAWENLISRIVASIGGPSDRPSTTVTPATRPLSEDGPRPTQ